MFGTVMYLPAGVEMQMLVISMRKTELELKKLSGVTAYPMGTPSHGKCPCCGSSTYQQHKGRTICSYCRSVA